MDKCLLCFTLWVLLRGIEFAGDGGVCFVCFWFDLGFLFGLVLISFWCFDLTLIVLLCLVVVGFVSWFDLNRVCLCCVLD